MYDERQPSDPFDPFAEVAPAAWRSTQDGCDDILDALAQAARSEVTLILRPIVALSHRLAPVFDRDPADDGLATGWRRGPSRPTARSITPLDAVPVHEL